jgi:hypothetical protein
MKTGNVLGSFGLAALLVFVLIGAVAPKTERSVADGCLAGTATASQRDADATPAHEFTHMLFAVRHAQRIADLACQCVADRIMRDEGRVRMVLMDYGVLGARDIGSFEYDRFRTTLNLCRQDAEEDLLAPGTVN